MVGGGIYYSGFLAGWLAAPFRIRCEIGYCRGDRGGGAWISLAASLAVGLFTLYSMTEIGAKPGKMRPRGRTNHTNCRNRSGLEMAFSACLVLALITVMVGLGAGYF